MKQKIIGDYYIGFDQCQLVNRAGTGSEFYPLPEKGHIPVIKIGMDYDKWRHVLAVLLHEAFEFELARHHARWEPHEDMGNEMSGFLFVMTHVEYSDICAKVAEYIADCQRDLYKAWKKWHKRGKKG